MSWPFSFQGLLRDSSSCLPPQYRQHRPAGAGSRYLVDVLSVASEVRFLGYSMAPADFHARFILRCGFHNQEEGVITRNGKRAIATGRSRVEVVDLDKGVVEYLAKDLKTIGISIDSMFSIIMPETYVGLPLMDVDKPEKELEKKETAKKMLSSYTKIIKGHERGVIKTYKGHWPRTNSHLLGSVFVKWLVTDKPFWVKEDRCVKCGRCADVCPVGDIKGGGGMMPEWKHNDKCLTCFNCYHHCPTHAIEYGKRTKNKGQYYFK